MKHNTRFVPTITGPLHIGHLYMALVNANEAHRSGGKFVMRVDDTQRYWVHNIDQRLVDQYYDQYCENLSRFMTVDVFERQSNMPTVRDIIGEHEILRFIPKEMWIYPQYVEWIPCSEMGLYPCAPSLTMEKVVWDFYDDVTWLIRGEDLITEASLYSYFADCIGIPQVKQTYLPRLRTDMRGELGHTIISKTYKTFMLSDQIDEFGVSGVLDYLTKSCLVDPTKGFYVENIKHNPSVTGFKT